MSIIEVDPLRSLFLIVDQSVENSLTVLYRFHLEVHDGVARGVCQVDVVLNVAPTGGTVSIEPDAGLAVVDTFQITAAGWSDEDIPLTYRFFYSMSDKSDNGELDARNPQIPLTETSVSATISSVLAVGQVAQNYTYTVFVTVSDVYEAAAQAWTPVVVRPYVPSKSFAEDADNRLAAAAASNNVQATTQLIGAFAASLNMQEEEAGGAATAETEEEQAARNADATATRALLAKSLLSIVSASASDGVDLSSAVKEAVAEGLKAVTANPNQMTTESLSNSLDAVAMLTQQAGASVAAVGSFAAVTSNLLQALSAPSRAATGANGNLTNAQRSASETEFQAQQKQFATATLNIVDQLGKALVADAIPGEEPTLVVTESFDISSQKNLPGAFAGAPLPIGASSTRRCLADGVEIVVPSGVFDSTAVTGESSVDAMLTVWSVNPYSFADTRTSDVRRRLSQNVADGEGGASDQQPLTIGSTVLGLSFAADGHNLVIRDLDEPFVMSLAPIVPLNDSTLFVHCAYWNTTLEKWVFDTRFGRGNVSVDGGITCRFDHLTDFTAFVGAPPAFNDPCFSCLDQLWSNPAGLVVTFACGAVLVISFGVSLFRYIRFSSYSPREILAMKFAEQRVKIMSPDEEFMSSLQEDIAHRLRHDYPCGGILCQIPGDPFDWSQRVLVFHTTLILSLMVSLWLFRPVDGEPQCVEECTQMRAEDPLECELVCQENPTNGLYVSVVSACISTPMVIGLSVPLPLNTSV